MGGFFLWFVVTTQPLPLDDSPEALPDRFQATKLGIVTPALRAAQVSLASSRLSSNGSCLKSG
jgi:hypothetical protein